MASHKTSSKAGVSARSHPVLSQPTRHREHVQRKTADALQRTVGHLLTTSYQQIEQRDTTHRLTAEDLRLAKRDQGSAQQSIIELCAMLGECLGSAEVGGWNALLGTGNSTAAEYMHFVSMQRGINYPRLLYLAQNSTRELLTALSFTIYLVQPVQKSIAQRLAADLWLPMLQQTQPLSVASSMRKRDPNPAANTETTRRLQQKKHIRYGTLIYEQIYHAIRLCFFEMHSLATTYAKQLDKLQTQIGEVFVPLFPLIGSISDYIGKQNNEFRNTMLVIIEHQRLMTKTYENQSMWLKWMISVIAQINSPVTVQYNVHQASLIDMLAKTQELLLTKRRELQETLVLMLTDVTAEQGESILCKALQNSWYCDDHKRTVVYISRTAANLLKKRVRTETDSEFINVEYAGQTWSQVSAKDMIQQLQIELEVFQEGGQGSKRL